MMLRVIVPGVAALAMGSLIALELAGDLGDEGPDLPEPARIAGLAELSSPVVPNVDAAEQDVLAHPLFTPNRQPSVRPAAGGGPSAADAFRRKLTGIAIGETRRVALFAGEGRDKPAVVVEGGSIEGWTVDDIATGAVTVTAGARSQTVEIARHKPSGGEARTDTASAAAPAAARRDR
ncbi:MAG: hypothetical protein JO128_12210 [Alphaproteobacteria bacterium]|nr:hypothetical protein [Alphaproteobacteria bacterium]